MTRLPKCTIRLLHTFTIVATIVWCLPSFSQSVQQSGAVVVNHVPAWITNGVIGDGGTASDSPITSLGVTNATVPGFCVNSGRATAAGRQRLCLGAPLNSAAQITLQNFGTATAQDLQFVINGTTITLPTGGGATLPSITTPLVNNDIICASGTAGALVGCTLGTAGQLLVGQGATAPAWVTIDGDITSISAGGNIVVGKVNGVTYPASPSVGTAPYVSSSNTVTYGSVPVTGGGTGVATLTAGGVLVGNGTNAVVTASTSSIGLCLLSNGAGTAPSFQSCAAGSGSAAGLNTQVQFNNSTALAGSPNFTWISPALTIGQNATATGQLVLANGSALGTSVTIQNLGTTSAWNFNLPTSAGSSGQPLLSGGGGAGSMTFGTLGTAAGGTNCTSPSGTCIDNISGFSSTGFINRTGAGTYAFTTTIGLINGGTGANLTASTGGIVYSGASALAILSGTATANQVLLSGASAAPAWSTATYPTTTTINQLLYSSSANTIVGLATGNSGVLITSAGGVPSISSTLPSTVQGNITSTGTIATGVWNGTSIDLAHGGTNANLTASVGGIFYSTASAGAILSGTATAALPLLSGASAAPTWATVSYPASATSGGVAYFSSNTAMASSAALTANAVVLGGGAGAAPATTANATMSAGQLTLGQTGSVAGKIVLSGSTSGTGTIQTPAAAGTGTLFQIPDTNGSNGQVLTTDGTGVLTWTSVAGTGTVTSITCASTLACTATNPITSSGTIALNLSSANTWAAVQTFTNSDIKLLGSSTGATTFTSANAGASNFTLTFPAITSTVTTTIASGAKALATGAISSATCTTAQTDTATGTLTTDAIIASFNGDPTAVTGYVPLTTGMLTIIPYPTADTVNFKVCNNTAASITPGAITINWRVVR